MKIPRWPLFLLMVSGAVAAEDIKMLGSLHQRVQVPHYSRSIRETPVNKQITLMKVELSENARQKLANRTSDALKALTTASDSPATLPRSIQLGMGNVPVLDQGYYGSCVAFAVTAAIDAFHDKGDYISQLCLLQLGRYLESNAFSMSGWDGAPSGDVLLNRINVFGVISKSQQEATGCGGLTEYPLQRMGNEPGLEMSAAEYHQHSHSLPVGWSTILDEFQVFEDEINTEGTLEQVKTALNAGQRLPFAVLLPNVELGVAGAVGQYHAKYDSWVLTSDISKHIGEEIDMASHEMVITGYDDDAVAIDENGRSHTGLLTLRNSWGDKVGDKGDFYMSYDFFKVTVLEVIRIRY